MLGTSPIAKLPIAKNYQYEVSTDPVIFNGNSISDCGQLFADRSNYDDINKIKLESFDAPNVDGGGVLSYYINGKSINFRLIMRQNTEEELNSAIDDLKKKLAVPDGLLELTINGERRNVYVALTSLSFNRNFAQKTIQDNVNIEFLAMNHFFSKVTDNQTFPTLGNFDADVYYQGTVGTFFKVYMVFNTGNVGITDTTIVKDGYDFTIIQPISDGDILLYDGVNKEVRLNDTLIDYTGAFREFEIGSNPFSVNFNGGAVVNATITILYNKQRL